MDLEEVLDYYCITLSTLQTLSSRLNFVKNREYSYINSNYFLTPYGQYRLDEYYSNWCCKSLRLKRMLNVLLPLETISERLGLESDFILTFVAMKYEGDLEAGHILEFYLSIEQPRKKRDSVEVVRETKILISNMRKQYGWEPDTIRTFIKRSCPIQFNAE